MKKTKKYLLKVAKNLKCCGNCNHFGYCFNDFKMRNALCKSWEYDGLAKKERRVDE